MRGLMRKKVRRQGEHWKTAAGLQKKDQGFALIAGLEVMISQLGGDVAVGAGRGRAGFQSLRRPAMKLPAAGRAEFGIGHDAQLVVGEVVRVRAPFAHDPVAPQLIEALEQRILGKRGDTRQGIHE